MPGHKQEREGLPLPRCVCSLHHKEQAGGCSKRTDGRVWPLFPVHCYPVSRPWRAPSLMQSLYTLRAAAKQTNRGHLSIWGSSCFCRRSVNAEESAGQESARGRTSTPRHTSNTAKGTHIPGHWHHFWNSPSIPVKFFYSSPPPRNTNKPTQTQCGKNTKLLHWWISQMHFPILLVQKCQTREISQNSKQPVLIHHSLKFTITNNWHIIWGLSNFKMYHRLKQTKTALDFYFRGNCRNKKTR